LHLVGILFPHINFNTTQKCHCPSQRASYEHLFPLSLPSESQLSRHVPVDTDFRYDKAPVVEKTKKEARHIITIHYRQSRGI